MRNECCNCRSSSWVRPFPGNELSQPWLQEATGQWCPSKFCTQCKNNICQFLTYLLVHYLFFHPIEWVWVARRKDLSEGEITNHFQISSTSVLAHSNYCKCVSVSPSWSVFAQLACDTSKESGWTSLSLVLLCVVFLLLLFSLNNDQVLLLL